MPYMYKDTQWLCSLETDQVKQVLQETFYLPSDLVCGTAFNGNVFARPRTLGISDCKVQIFL